MKMGMKHNMNDWAEAMSKIRKEFPEDTKKLVHKHTRNISRGAKSSVPTVYAGIKSNIRPKVEGMTGDVIVGVYYAPYPEYGTGNKVQVPNELKEYAMQFKGKGIKNVNIDPRPYLYPHFFREREEFFKNMKKGLAKISDRNMQSRRRLR